MAAGSRLAVAARGGDGDEGSMTDRGGQTGVVRGGSVIVDDDRRIVSVSPGLARLLGHEPAEMVGHTTLEWVVGDPDAIVAEEEQPSTGPWAEVSRRRLQLQHRDGSMLWVRSTRARLGEGGGGVIIIDDISEQVEAEAVLATQAARTAFLSELSVALSEAGPDVRAVLDRLTRALGRFYDACSIARLVGGDGVYRVAASYGADAERTSRLVDRTGELTELVPWVNGVLRSGRALAGRVDDLVAGASEEVASLVADLGLSGALTLPLLGPDGPVGLVAVVRFGPGGAGDADRVVTDGEARCAFTYDDAHRAFTHDDAVFADQVARLASLALENARLVAALEARTEAAEEVTEELRRAVRLLGSSIAQRRALVRRLARAQEDERSRIAVEIHDDSIQVLTGVGLKLQLLRRLVSGAAATDILDDLEQTVASATDRLRHVLFDLRPPALELKGLALSVEELADRLLAPSGCQVSVRSMLGRPPSSLQAAVVYRIAKEALTNVARHAQAVRVDVVFEDRSGGLLLRVSDDGVGFDPAVTGDDRRFGLPLMREQAELAEGWLTLSSQPGRGTTLEAWVPGGDSEGGGTHEGASDQLGGRSSGSSVG